MDEKDNLRQRYIDEYGLECGILYDKLNSVGFFDTISILKMIGEVEKWHTHKNIFQRLKEKLTSSHK